VLSADEATVYVTDMIIYDKAVHPLVSDSY